MRALAEADGDIYVPNPEPNGPVQYVLICMEPSLGRWARSADEARAKVEAGFRNFLSSDETSILHFCIRRYLCTSTQRYHITDISKGAMLVKRGALARKKRWDRWYGLLNEEVDLVATPNARIVAVGSKVYQYLQGRGFPRPLTQVIHYSALAGSARMKHAAGREDDFRMFQDSVSHQDLVATSREVLASAHVPARIREETLSRLETFRLTTSRQQLIFNYKIAFESMRS
jgi:hypothetical protein